MFEFKQFKVDDQHCAMKVSTDGVLLGAWAQLPPSSTSQGLTIDLGAGCGLLSLMMAQRGAHRIVAVEIDPMACTDARHNIEASPWSDRIEVVCADALSWQPAGTVVHVISNPPFFTETLHSPDLQRAQARHTQAFGPTAVLHFAKRHLSADGSIALILPAQDMAQITYHAEMIGLKLRRQCLISSVAGRPPIRAMAQFSPQDGPIEKTALILRDTDHTLTVPYRHLTHDFYL